MQHCKLADRTTSLLRVWNFCLMAGRVKKEEEGEEMTRQPQEQLQQKPLPP